MWLAADKVQFFFYKTQINAAWPIICSQFLFYLLTANQLALKNHLTLLFLVQRGSLEPGSISRAFVSSSLAASIPMFCFLFIFFLIFSLNECSNLVNLQLTDTFLICFHRHIQVRSLLYTLTFYIFVFCCFSLLLIFFSLDRFYSLHFFFFVNFVKSTWPIWFRMADD